MSRWKSFQIKSAWWKFKPGMVGFIRTKNLGREVEIFIPGYESVSIAGGPSRKVVLLQDE